MPVRVGVYRITAELQGFTTVVRPGIQLLVGQTLIVNLQMAPSTIEETDHRHRGSAAAEGRYFEPRRQHRSAAGVRRCPCRGATGARCCCSRRAAVRRATTPTGSNSRNADRIREFQTNIDGQQFQNTMGGGGQPTFSQEMIAEFQFISNRFDATQGRSSGLQVNLVTKSGTNRFAGSFRSNFRDDRFNAADPVLERVTPFKNQQYAGTFGGPILRDRLHFFVFDEYEREPKEETWKTPYPRFNVSLEGTSTKKIGGTRLDYQLSPQTRLMFRLNMTKTADAVRPRRTPSTRRRPSRGWETRTRLAVQLTNVLSNRTLNELMVGHAGFLFGEENLTTVVQSLAGGRAARSVPSPPARRASRSPTSPSAATPARRAIESRISTGQGQLHHRRTTRVAATT